MKWIEAKIIFDHPNSGLADSGLAADLIADVFHDFELQGVVVDDPNLKPEEDWAEDDVGRPTQHAVTGYIRKDHRADSRCITLEDKLEQLKQKLGLFYRISYKELDEQDWAHSWKAYFWPQKISSNIVVKPTWRDYQAEDDEVVIELDPGMAFGTGTHPTTVLCITMIERYLRRGDSFLDVGTGSGILMIAAAKLGAGRLCGVDKDAAAIEVAALNLRLNRVNPGNFRLIAGNLVDDIHVSYNFIAANIVTHVILELLNNITGVLSDGGVFVCSGVIDVNKNSIISAIDDLGFEVLEIASKDEWAAIAARLASPRPQEMK